MTSVLLATLTAAGVYLLLTHDRPWRTRTPGDGSAQGPGRVQVMLHQAGLGDLVPWQFLAASASVGLLAVLLASAVLGLGPSTLLIGFAAACLPSAIWRHRRDLARRAAREAWPRMIEELRVLTGSVGRPVPQALLEVGAHGPAEMQPAFRAAQREWALTTDFERTIRVLTERLADPTADTVCETLLVASQVGGDLDGRLQALDEDRRQDLDGRREAAAEQAGARFARWFVVIVPAGMALAGLNVGDGAQAYRTPMGQLLVSAGIGLVAVCWWWASRIMRLPEDDRIVSS